MGVIRFQVHPPRKVTVEMAHRAYFTAPDRTLWKTRTRVTDEGLAVERIESDSGYFHIPWHVEGQGELTLSTGWLMEREQPYQLEIELARGKICQVRSQLFEWQAIGLSVPEELEALVKDAVARLAHASTLRDEPKAAAKKADHAIRVAVQAAQWLGRCYAEQSLSARLHQRGKLETQVGVHLGDVPLQDGVAPLVKGSFNTGCVPLRWRKIEATECAYDWSVSDQQVAWCQEKGLLIHAGPLLAFDELGMPEWLCLQTDFGSLAGCVGEFITAAVKRYKGRVSLWRCAARINVADVLGLEQEERLRLAAEAVQITRELDPDTPAIVSFDQPWGEYTGRETVDFPRYLADTLVRANVGLTGLGLEINVGYHPGGSYPRDVLELSQLVDAWAVLGLPLHVTLTIPSGSSPDPQARSECQPLSTAYASGWTTKIQQNWTELYLPLLLSKGNVHSVAWSQLRDAEPHAFPHGGLFDIQDRPKPALGIFAAVREKFLA
jgi:hypothetical protein